MINGGAGTDTLKITSDNATVNMATATISGVENLEINQDAVGAVAATSVALNSVAYTQVTVEGVAGVDGGADTFAITGAVASSKLVLKDLADVATTITYTGVSGTADTATVEIAGSTEDATNAGENDLTIANIETLNLSFTTAANDLDVVTAAAAKTVNITVGADADTTLRGAAALGAATAVNIDATGDLTLAATAALANDAVITVTGAGDVDLNTLDDNGADNGVTVAASALTGGLTVTGGANTVSITSGSGADTVTTGAVTTAVSLGAGNDTFNTNSLDFGGATAVNVDGGEGTDTINHDVGVEWDADFVAHVKNFEILDIGGGSGVYDANLIALEAVEVNADLGGAATITDLTDEAVRITATTTAALTLELDDNSGSTDALSFTIEGAAVDTGADGDTSNDTNDLTVAEVVTAGIETVTVASNTAATNEAGANNILSVIATDATKLVITGNHALEITDFQDDTSGGVNTDTVTIDASASAGLIMGDYVSGLNVSILGSEFADTILVGDDDGTGTGTATGSTVNAGAGGDVVTISVAGAVDTLIINAGDSKIGYTDTNADQAFTTAADAELYDIVTGFTSGEDTIDLGSFGFTGTKASALAGPSLTEANAVKLVNGTTTSIASFFVDTGVQRGVAVVSGDFSDLGGTGTDTLVFIDSDGNGNLTSADDMIVLAGVATVALADFGF